MVIQDARARRSYGDFGLDLPPGAPDESGAADSGGGSFWTGLTSVLTAAAPVVQAVTAHPASAYQRTPPPVGMQYTSTGQLVPKQTVGGISTTTLLLLAAAGAGALVLMRKRRRR